MLIDITRLLGRSMRGRLPTGVDRVVLEYLRQYRNEATGVVRYRRRWLEFNFRDSQILFDGLLNGQPYLKQRIQWLVGRSLLVQAGRKISNDKLLLNIGHTGLECASHFRYLDKSSLAPIFFIHDLIPITHPEYCRLGEADRHRFRIDSALRLAKGLIVNSAFTLKELRGFAECENLPMPPTAIAKLAAPSFPLANPSRPLERPYFVVLGTIEPRKNHLLLLHLWRELITELGDQAPLLVVIGQRGWECENIVDLLDRCEVLSSHVRELSRCSDELLASYLQHAQALLFPSFVEGYGMPLIESLSLGTPVICSDLSVFREIAGDVPEFVSPIDGCGWKRLVLEFAKPDSPARAAQLRRLAGFKAPTWDEHFAQVDELIEKVRAL